VLVGLGVSGRSGLINPTVVGCFDLGRGAAVEFAVDAFVVEPPDPAAGGDLEVIETLPVAAVGGEDGGVAVQLGLVERVHRLGHRVIKAVADGADRRDRTDVIEAVRVCDRRVLAPASWWQTRPSRSTPRRVHAAMFNASTTRVANMDRAFQPTIRREYTSTTNATYTTPDHVEQYVKSATHS
jgi:hypothetical protein